MKIDITSYLDLLEKDLDKRHAEGRIGQDAWVASSAFYMAVRGLGEQLEEAIEERDRYKHMYERIAGLEDG